PPHAPAQSLDERNRDVLPVISPRRGVCLTRLVRARIFYYGIVVADDDCNLVPRAFRAGAACKTSAVRLAFLAAHRQNRLGVVMPVGVADRPLHLGVAIARDGLGRSV